MRRFIAAAIAALSALGCSSSAPSSAPSPATTGSPPAAGVAQGAPSSTSSTSPQVTDVFVRATTDVFHPATGDAALRAFVPEIAAVDSGGECSLLRTGGSGATLVTAFYPTRTKPSMQVTLMFDSVGHLVRYSEMRGVPPRITAMPRASLDSAMRAGIERTRSTVLSLDYAVDHATVMNRGGGKPTTAILGTVRAVESLAQLGPQKDRLDRVRKQCGV